MAHLVAAEGDIALAIAEIPDTHSAVGVPNSELLPLRVDRQVSHLRTRLVVSTASRCQRPNLPRGMRVVKGDVAMTY